jgi:hypothetical protein
MAPEMEPLSAGIGKAAMGVSTFSRGRLRKTFAIRRLVSRDAQRSAWSDWRIHSQVTPSAPLRVAANQEVISSAFLNRLPAQAAYSWRAHGPTGKIDFILRTIEVARDKFNRRRKLAGRVTV